MNKANSGVSNLFMSIFEIVLGILLLINPIGFTSGIIIALGIVLTVMGIGQIKAEILDRRTVLGTARPHPQRGCRVR